MAHPITASLGSSYVADTADEYKQVPAPLPPNAYDRIRTPSSCVLVKQPHAVMFPTSGSYHFFFGGSGSFSAAQTSEGQTDFTLTQSRHYQNFGSPPVGM